MSVFSSDRFLETVKKTYFDSDQAKIGLANVDGKRYKTLIIEGDRPVTAIPFMDYIEPLSESVSAGDLREISSPRIRKVVLAEGELGSSESTQELIASFQNQGTAKHPKGYNPGAVISPTIRLDRIEDFTTYQGVCRKRNSRAFSKRTGKKLYKLETEDHKIELCFRVDDARKRDVLSSLLHWKEQQYLRTDVPNLFAIASHRQFMENLLASDLLVLSAVFLGGKPIAAHAGFIEDNAFYYLLPGYDMEYRQGAAGLFLMEYMIEQSHAEGLGEFDFLLGDEEYKFYYADYFRIVGMAGKPDQWQALCANGKQALKNLLFRNETIKNAVKSFMKSRRQRGAS